MDLVELEKQRQDLEMSLQKLREGLRHWQMWEAEYEGLKEEIQRSKADPSAEELNNIAESYDGELVNAKEIRELSGLDKHAPRSSPQIINVIERRQEYVQKNIETVQRQFFDAEAKSEELAFAAANQSPSGRGAGLPLTEIHEELDEDGNVISSSLNQPEESTANIIASLRKAGLKESDLEQSRPRAEELKPAITNASPPVTPSAVAFQSRGESDTVRSRASSGGTDDLERPSIRKKSVSFTADTKPPEERRRQESEDGKKSVSFAEKVAVMPAAPPPDTRAVSFSPVVEEIPPQPLGPASPEVAPKVSVGAQNASIASGGSDSRSVEQDEVGGAEIEEVVIPEAESPEDARTRREMLEYHLTEVGNVVAQIDLDEPDVDAAEDDEDDSSSFYTTSEYLEDEDTPYTTGLSESEEEEDEYGRSRPKLSPEYIKHMEDLQRRLIGNLGPDPKDEDVAAADPDLDTKDVRRLVVRGKSNSTSSASSDNSEKKPGSKKRVSFAESLDVAEPGSPPLKAQKHQEGENVAPITSNVVERTTAASHSLPQSISNEAQSQFKRSRLAPTTYAEEPEPADDMTIDSPPLGPPGPTGPPGVTIAETITERPIPTTTPPTAPSEENFDPLTERRELAAEYHRRRNDLIQQQGGFANAGKEDDKVLGELMEERDGRVKKVSRFMAARLNQQQ